MTLKNTAVFAQTPKTTSATATAAYNLTGAGSLVDDAVTNTVKLMTAGADGSLVTSVRAIPRGTVTATQVAVFIRKAADAAGVRKLLTAMLVPAQTVSATAAVVEYAFPLFSETSPLRLEAGDELYVGQAVAQSAGINFHAAYTDF